MERRYQIDDGGMRGHVVASLIRLYGCFTPSGVMARSGVLTLGSSGGQIDLSYLDTVFELYSSYHLGQIVEAA